MSSGTLANWIRSGKCTTKTKSCVDDTSKLCDDGPAADTDGVSVESADCDMGDRIQDRFPQEAASTRSASISYTSNSNLFLWADLGFNFGGGDKLHNLTGWTMSARGSGGASAVSSPRGRCPS